MKHSSHTLTGVFIPGCNGRVSPLACLRLPKQWRDRNHSRYAFLRFADEPSTPAAGTSPYCLPQMQPLEREKCVAGKRTELRDGTGFCRALLAEDHAAVPAVMPAEEEGKRSLALFTVGRIFIRLPVGRSLTAEPSARGRGGNAQVPRRALRSAHTLAHGRQGRGRWCCGSSTCRGLETSDAGADIESSCAGAAVVKRAGHSAWRTGDPRCRQHGAAPRGTLHNRRAHTDAGVPVHARPWTAGLADARCRQCATKRGE
jgi:hypothetical protein